MESASRYCFVELDEEQQKETFDYEALNADVDRRRKEKKVRKKVQKKEKEEDEMLALSDDDEKTEYSAIPQARLRQVRKADPNVLAIKLGTLAQDAVTLFTGDPVFCKQCSAALTEISEVLVNPADSGQQWKCEYCDFLNSLQLEPEEMPKGESIDYLVNHPPDKSEFNDIIVFCIDISGSMCCTSEVTGDIKIKTNQQLSQSLDQFIERQNGVAAVQYLPNESREISYVSRLLCLQAAITSQIEQLVKEHPKKRIAIVTFNNDVNIYLPGNIKQVITGDKLDQYDFLINSGNALANLLQIPIENSHEELTKIVLGLEENGATALGPALLTSISIAGNSRGSSVILCTDGIANIGVGSLENYVPDDNSPAALFYQKVSDDALQKGVAVSILSIKGTTASLEYIAKVSADTRGINHIVDPLKLTKSFNFILQNTIIATDVSATMFLNKALTFRHEKNVIDNGFKAVREVGNVTAESTITFEYFPQDKQVLKEAKELCFQIQINFTKLDGSRCVRIMSKRIEVTHNRDEAEKNVNVNVVGLHCQFQAAQKAAEGKYTAARMIQKRNMRMVRRGMATEDVKEEQKAQYELWNQEAVRLNAAIKKTKLKEKAKGINYYSGEEEGSDSEEEKVTIQTEQVQKKNQKQQERKARRGEEDDDFSNQIYQAKNPLYSAFTYEENGLYDNDEE